MLHHHLVGIDDLVNTYTLYQMSFNKVLVEVARRREYKEAAEDIVSGMMAQLQAMTDGRFLFHACIGDGAPLFSRLHPAAHPTSYEA